MTTYTITEAQRQQLLDVSLAGLSTANTLATKMLQSLAPNGGDAVAWQCKEVGGEFWQDCNEERAGVRAAKPDKWEVRELFTHPAPNYDQQALELCCRCGWKAIFPGEDCLVCAKSAPSCATPQAAPSTSHDAFFDNSDAHLLNDAGDDWEAAPSTSPENADAEENVRLDAELQRCMKERDVLRTELAALRAAPSTSAERIYQYQLANGNWIDQTKEMYDHLIKRGGSTVRAVYLSAPSTSPADIAEIERLIELVKNQNAYLMVADNQLQTALAEISALKAAPSTSQLTDWDIAADMEVADAKWADADVPLGWAKHFARAIELKIKGGA